MGESTLISWCHHTFNAWEGCEKISPACKHCYAEAMNRWLRGGENWGPNTPRRFFGDAHWRKPHIWNAKAIAAGERRRVFVNSISDIGEDRRDLDEHRERLWDVIRKCQQLDFLLLTKRPEVLRTLLPWGEDGDPWLNVWGGTTVEDDDYAKRRLPELKRMRVAVRFVSYEPALGFVNWDAHLRTAPNIHWVIFGDESGRERRPAQLEWARCTRDACEEYGVPFHFKQWCGDDVPGVLGDRVKQKIHLPILDGVRHAAFPEVRHG